MFRLFFLVFILTAYLASGQGKLMLVGGGSEKDAAWGWSNMPYAWAVDQSSDGKVAIISYSESSDPEWLPDYFISLGATQAKNFVVQDREEANSPSLKTELLDYDVIFFKGGDQSVYYTQYKDTQLSQAVEEVYLGGGVIAGTSAGMAILTGIVYSAEGSSIYPDQALGGLTPDNITLRTDMFSFLPGFLGDTHFAERGRLPRLVTFLGAAEELSEQAVTGIGVDDQTAFCIDASGKGTVYGTGAVTIINIQQFSSNSNLPEAEAEVKSLLHGQVYDLTAQTIVNPYTTPVQPEVSSIALPYEIFLTGSEGFSENASLLEELLINSNKPVFVVGPMGNQTTSILEGLQALTQHVIHIPPLQGEVCEQVAERNQLREGGLVIFTGNTLQTLQNYLTEDATGKVIIESLSAGRSRGVFLGRDAMLAGSRFVVNNLEDDLNAFYGDLSYADGLSILPSSIIMSGTYDPSSTDFYENNTAAVMYSMIQDELYSGIYLNERSWVRIFQEGGITKMEAGGAYAAMVLRNTATSGALASQPVNSSDDYRNIAGFDQMTLNLLGSDILELGNTQPSLVEISDPEILPTSNFAVVQTPGGLSLTWSYEGSSPGIFSLERAIEGEDFEFLAELSVSVRQYTDEDVLENTPYVYRIRIEAAEISSCYQMANGSFIITSREEVSRVRVFPNPAHDLVKVEGVMEGSYQLLDLTGKQLSNGRLHEASSIPVSFLKNGIYLLIIREGGVVMHQKIHIKRGLNTLTGN